MADHSVLVVFCVGQSSGEEVVPANLGGLVSLEVTPEPNRTVVSCVYDVSIASKDKFSSTLRSELDSKGILYDLAPLTSENHVVLISVEGMTCNSCVNLIETTVRSHGGVSGAKVSLEAKEAFVQFNPLVTTAEMISTAIYDMGFDTNIKRVYTPRQPSGLGDVSVEIEPPVDLPTSGGEEVCYTCIAVEGMVCQSCVKNIESNVSKLSGVHEVKVSLEEKSASIAYSPKLINPNKLASEIDDLGFEAKVKDSSGRECSKSPVLGVLKKCCIGIEGMKCHSCVNLIESTLGDMKGVVTVQVSLPLKEGTMEYNDALVHVDAITTAIEDMGFIVKYVTGEGYNYSILCVP